MIVRSMNLRWISSLFHLPSSRSVCVSLTGVCDLRPSSGSECVSPQSAHDLRPSSRSLCVSLTGVCDLRPSSRSLCVSSTGVCDPRPSSGSECDLRPSSGSECDLRPSSGSECDLRPSSGSECVFPQSVHDLRPVSESECDLRLSSMLEFSGVWTDEERGEFLRDMCVYEDFVSEEEEDGLMDEVGIRLKRQRYEFDHWDDAIHGFREVQIQSWREHNTALMARIRRTAAISDAAALRSVHVLDLSADGVIKPHVDSVRFCGPIIAGVSLLSPAVMRLIASADDKNNNNNNDENGRRWVDCLLARRSLYVMRDSVRYNFTHEVLGADCSQFRGQRVVRDRRVSIICRCLPPPPSTS